MNFTFPFVFLSFLSISFAFLPQEYQFIDSKSPKLETETNFNQSEEFSNNTRFKDQSEEFSNNRQFIDQSERFSKNLKFIDQSEWFSKNLKFIDQSEKNSKNDQVYFLIQKTTENQNFDFNEMFLDFSSRNFNPMWMVRKNFSMPMPKKKSINELRKEKCDIKFGVLVNDECYQFFPMESKNYEDARTFCKGKGGDLWTPAFNDSELLGKIIPELISAPTAGKLIWVGAKENGGKLFDIHGNDITKSFFFINSDDSGIMSQECALLDFEDATYQSQYEACTFLAPFVCEYPITLDMTPMHWFKFIKNG